MLARSSVAAKSLVVAFISLSSKGLCSPLNKRALAMEGTCTGEHGIGQGKMNFLRDELGASVDVMRLVKRALDPQNIFNPGKIFM